jgi:type II secretion system protein J
MSSLNSHSRGSGGFTLLELLAATLMFAIVIGALYSVSHGALKMREKAYTTFEEELPNRYMTSLMGRDLAGTVIPVGVLAGPMMAEKAEEGDRRADRLEIYTSTGVIDDDDPWGDIQKVGYSLMDTENAAEGDGKDLVRAVTRNLLYELEEDIEQQHLITGVRSLEFACYDGEIWQDSWDSTARENALPLAIRVLITFVEAGPGEQKKAPLEIYVPIVAKAPSTTQEESESTQEGNAAAESGGTRKGANG